jgi:hypothetical protein
MGYRAQHFEHPALDIKAVEQDMSILGGVLEPVLNLARQRTDEATAYVVERRKCTVMASA